MRHFYIALSCVSLLTLCILCGFGCCRQPAFEGRDINRQIEKEARKQGLVKGSDGAWMLPDESTNAVENRTNAEKPTNAPPSQKRAP